VVTRGKSTRQEEQNDKLADDHPPNVVLVRVLLKSTERELHKARRRPTPPEIRQPP
jgi:hypothetical protein